MTRITVCLVFAIFLISGCQSLPSSVCEPYNDTSALAKIPGTDWQGCDGDCNWVTEQGTGKVKCVSGTCSDPCSCRVFSRPKAGWNGDWNDEGAWPDPQEKESGRHYRCWCVQPAP